MSADTPVINLGYRPQSYFWPITHDTHVIAAIKGERRRSAIRAAFDADRVTPLDELYASPTLPDEDRRALGEAHPQPKRPLKAVLEMCQRRFKTDSPNEDVVTADQSEGVQRSAAPGDWPPP
jgi:hypothetical protein